MSPASVPPDVAASRRAFERFVVAACRRELLNAVLAQTVFALIAALVALLALLILGTQLLQPYIPLAIFLGAIAVAVARLLRRPPGAYRVLQRVDHSLGLHDTLSSAYYYGTEQRGCSPTPALGFLLQQAERLAGELDAARAVPLTVPRSTYALIALAVVASGLFGLRYGVSRTMDLRLPLAAVVFPDGSHAAARRDLPEHARRQQGSRFREALEKLGIVADHSAAEAASSSEHLEFEGDSSPELAAAPPSPDIPKPIPFSLGEERLGEGSPDERAAAFGNEQPGGQDRSARAPRTPQPWQNQNTDLWEKFRDALASLLSQLKPRSGASESQSNEMASEQAAASSGSRVDRSERGTMGQGRQSEGDASEQGDGEQDLQSLQASRSPSGRPGGRSPDTQPAREGRSGIGREDGRKEAREAEQLAAIGKLTELFGRRQATLSGEVTIEVASGSQKVRTPYSQQTARHSDSGAGVSRDEVPLFLQPYVQRYLEEVRRLGAGGEGRGTTRAPRH